MADEILAEETNNLSVVVKTNRNPELEKIGKVPEIELIKKCTPELEIFEINVLGMDKCVPGQELSLEIRTEVQNKKNNG